MTFVNLENFVKKSDSAKIKSEKKLIKKKGLFLVNFLIGDIGM